MLHVERAQAVILTYPDGCVRPELLWWLNGIGIEVERTLCLNIDSPYDVCCAYNVMIERALDKDAEEYLFAERDIRPHPARTQPFITHAAEVVGAVYDVGNDRCFDDPASFHTGLWRATRRALEQINYPWFEMGRNVKGTELTQCPCMAIREKFQAAGIFTAHAGWVAHTPRHRHT